MSPREELKRAIIRLAPTGRPNNQDAEHTAIVELLQNPPQTNAENAIRYRARRRRMDEIRKRRRFVDAEKTVKNVVDSGPSPEAELQKRETREIVRRACQQLPQNLRNVIDCQLAGLSFKQIANQLGLPLSTTSVQAKRARQMLASSPELRAEWYD